MNKDLLEVMELAMRMPVEDRYFEREQSKCAGPEMRMC